MLLLATIIFDEILIVFQGHEALGLTSSVNCILTVTVQQMKAF